MDRAISQSLQRQRALKKWGGWLASALVLASVMYITRVSLETKVKRARIRTAVAEIGAVRQMLTASGLVLPSVEEILAAPATAGIRGVFVSEGAVVRPGQLLLSLDKEPLSLEYEKGKDELELRRSNSQKLRHTLDKSLFDLRIEDSIKALNIQRLESALENARRLEKIGGATQEQAAQAALDLRIARLEKRQLEHDLRVKQEIIKSDLRESELQTEIQEKVLREMARKLQLKDIGAPRAGVVTWINQKIGSMVREGEQLVKIANLDSYRLEGSVADLYADRIRAGMVVLARLGDTLLSGMVTNIRPAVENDILTFDVRLDEPRHPSLRPNMRVELFVVTEWRENVVRVANGPAFGGASFEDLFVLDGERAVRRRVPIGLSNFEYVELRDQVSPGETVIISDLRDYRHLKEIKLVD
jgi:HlyD family secretion protein